MSERSRPRCSDGSLNITGCRMLLAPMCDNYVEVILEAIKNTNTDRVWKHTDSLGTLFRGQQLDVLKAVKELFLNAYKEDLHMVASLTFSKGCPGDVEADYLENIEALKSLPKHPLEDVECEATISFYSFGNMEYMDHIHRVIDIFKQMGVYSNKSHYSTILKGSVKEVFEAYNQALSYGFNNLSHYVVETNISVNSPSNKKEK